MGRSIGIYPIERPNFCVLDEEEVNEMLKFFPDESTYTGWIQTNPPIMRVEGDGMTLADDVEPPDFYDECHLILRVRGDYRVVVRVAAREHADFTWYVKGAEQDTGEEVFAAEPENAAACDGSSGAEQEVFAAYLWYKQEIVGGAMIQQAKATLTAFLKQHSNWSAPLRLLSNR